jgi:hypothetical protein
LVYSPTQVIILSRELTGNMNIYARRASAGNFDGKNVKHKPVFHLNVRLLSPVYMTVSD